MTGLWGWIAGDQTLALAANVFLQVTLLTLLALLVAGRFRHNATVRHCVLLCALMAVSAIPVLTIVAEATGFSVIAIPVRWNSADAARPAARTRDVISPIVVDAIPQPQADEAQDMASDAFFPSGVLSGGDDPEPTWTPCLILGGYSRWAARAALQAWLLGCAVALVGIARSGWKTRRIVREARPVSLGKRHAIVEDVCGALGVQSLPKVACSSHVAAPTVVGIFRPVLILPTRLVGILSPTELRDILLHETAHVLRRDPLVVLFQRVLGAVFWPHPLVHLVNRQLARAREEVCDNYVLSTVAPADYGETLLRLGQLMPRPRLPLASAGIFNRYWKLENRIAGLLDRRRNPMVRLRPALATAIFLVALALSLGVAGSRVGWAVEPLAEQEQPCRTRDDVSAAVDRTIELIERHPAQRVEEKERLALYVMDVVTGEASLVAEEPAAGLTYCGSPCWSGDGRRILFDASPGMRFAKTRIMAVDATGSDLRLVDVGAGNCPTTSPDGERIAFFLNPGAVEGEEPGVWLMDADGSNRRRLAGLGGFIKWSPDGRHLLVSSFRSPLRLTLVEVETGQQRPVKLTGYNLYSRPSWAGDGQTIVVLAVSESGIGIVLVDVSEPEQAEVKQVLWRRKDRLDVAVAHPVYSPKTRRCIFVGKDDRGMALYVVHTGQFDPPKRLESGGYDNKIAALAFSPDGRYLLFCSDRPKTDPQAVSAELPPMITTALANETRRTEATEAPAARTKD